MGLRALRIAVLALAAAGVAYTLAQAMRAAQGDPALTDPAPGPAARLVVYFFDQGKHCDTCDRIPAYTREALETHFPAELAAGVIEWRVLSVEDPAHAHYVTEYGLYAKAIVLVEADARRRGAHKNLTAIWDRVHDKAAYAEYIRTEVRAALEGAW